MMFPVRLKVSYHTGELDGDVIESVKSTHVLEHGQDIPVLCNFLDSIQDEIHSWVEIEEIINKLESGASECVSFGSLHFRLI